MGRHLASVDARCRDCLTHLAMRLSHAHAQRRRAKHARAPVGRTCALDAARAARAFTLLDASCRPSRHHASRVVAQYRAATCTTPRLRRHSAQEATPRGEQRAPCRSSLRCWTPRLPPWWLPAAQSAADSRPHASLVGCVPAVLCDWGRTGAWTAPQYSRLPERFGNRLGAGAPSRQSWRLPGLPVVILRRHHRLLRNR